MGEPMVLGKTIGEPMALGYKTMGIAHDILNEDHGGSPRQTYVYVCMALYGYMFMCFLETH